MTNLLYKYSQRKHGWRVAFLLGEDGKKPIRGKLMVINDRGAEFLIEVPKGTSKQKKDQVLEEMTAKFIIDNEESDMMFMTRESLMFAVFARVIRTQSAHFVGYLRQEKKQDLQIFNDRVDMMLRTLEINYKDMLGKEQTELFLTEMEELVMEVFSIFKGAVDTGKLEEIRNHIKSFNTEKVVTKMEVEK